MIDIFYTGDARYNPDVSVKNHQKFFDELRKISKYTIHNFTKQDLERPICPYEDPADHRDVPGQLHRRRGESAKIQIWDFMSSLRRTSNPIIIKMRTDLWFTDSSIIHLILQIEKLLVGENDVVFVGSDFLPNSSCAEYQLIDYAITHLNVVQDYETFICNKPDCFYL